MLGGPLSATESERLKAHIFYEDDLCVVLHGDSLELLPLLEPVDHIVTDPPYTAEVYARTKAGTDYLHKRAMPDARNRMRTVHTEMHEQSVPMLTDEQVAACAVEFSRLCLRWAVVFTSVDNPGAWSKPLENAGMAYRRLAVWVKPNPTPQFTGDRPGQGHENILLMHRKARSRWNGGGTAGVWTVPLENNRHKQVRHPCAKPVPLMVQLLEAFTDPGERVLDPFAGSGSTLVAAKRLGLRSIAIEREASYCQLMASRLSQQRLPLGDELVAPSLPLEEPAEK
jgi:site-specific DNA-methyltransferase (adenine-specific)